MNGITFAEPLFLYFLAVVPAMIVFYVLKQQKASASLRVPALNPFASSGKTFRHYITACAVFIQDPGCCTPDSCSCEATGY